MTAHINGLNQILIACGATIPTSRQRMHSLRSTSSMRLVTPTNAGKEFVLLRAFPAVYV